MAKRRPRSIAPFAKHWPAFWLALAAGLLATTWVTAQVPLATPAGQPPTLVYESRYRADPYADEVFLEVPYADSTILNPEAWLDGAANRIPVAVTLVYTQYPKDTADWLTRYQPLNQGRINRLLALDPAFANPNIRWTALAQTAPKTEAQAKAMPHGLRVRYRLRMATQEQVLAYLQRHPNLGEDEQIALMTDLNLAEVRQLTRSLAGLEDSTVWHALQRLPQQQNLTLVLDWTGSMYRYGAQALHAQFKLGRVLGHVLLFNDGDDFLRARQHPNNPKQVGQTGGLYPLPNPTLRTTLETMELAMKRGNGGENEENDLEALLEAQQRFPQAERLVLVADRRSLMRDLELLPQLQLPVDVILCGPANERRPEAEAQYLQLAHATGGAIHTDTTSLRLGPSPPPWPIDFSGLRFGPQAPGGPVVPLGPSPAPGSPTNTP